MIDNDIIKALENIIKENEFEYYHSNTMCWIAEIKCALALIKHQKEEIDAYKHYYCECLEDLKKAHAEIERLKHKHDMAVAEREANMKGFLEELNRWNKETQKARSEAIKEFAERLKENIRMNCFCEKYVFEKDIDNLVKEMVGERE